MNNPGRFAGLLYIIASIPGFFALMYVPGKLIVHGNAATTAMNIAAHETLFRLGIAADLTGQAIFVFVVLALYDLFKDVNPRHALAMLTLALVAIPIAFLNEANSLAALDAARGADWVEVFPTAQRDLLARLFLNLRGGGFDLAGIFWGLWLFPLGMLVYRSGFLPRFLGVLLMLGTFAYLANSFTSLVLPQFEAAVARWMNPLQAVEIVFMLWLAVIGAKPEPAPSPVLPAAGPASRSGVVREHPSR